MGAIILILLFALSIWMSVRVLQKAGISGFWAATQVIPLVNIIVIWVFAFSRWPAVDDGPLRPRPPEKTISAWD